MVVPPPLLPPPQASRLPSAISNTIMPSMARQALRRAGMPKKTSRANSAPLPASTNPLLADFLTASDSIVAGVVLTASVAVPDVVEALSVIVPLGEQVGRLTAPLGEVVSAQLRETVPA